MTNKELKDRFVTMNERFFNNSIGLGYKVQFADIEDDGDHTPSEKLIRINKDLKSHPDLADVVLLHEMAHASLPDYVGCEVSGAAHGMRFMAKLDELYKKGAYDAIL